MAPVLGYWNFRGLCNPIRNLLAYVEEEHEEKLYDAGESRDSFFASEWFKEKHNHGLDFPNLPYYIDNERKITQSNAILRYLGRKHGLDANTEDERITLDVLEGVWGDLRLANARLVYDPNFEKLRSGFEAELPGKLKPVSRYISSKKWILGDRITYVDFLLYETLYQLHVLSADSFKEYQNLVDYIKRFEGMENIAKYHKSDRFINRPLNGPFAQFGKD